jgi:ubiquinone biosynthesis protein Coq4
MISEFDRGHFEALAQSGLSGADVAGLAAQVRAGGSASEDAAKSLAAAFAHAAFIAPERIADYYDQAARGWYGTPIALPPIEAPPPLNDTDALSPVFWSNFWGLVDDTGTGMDAGTVTMRTAALGAHLPLAYAQRLARSCMSYPGVPSAAANGPPGRFRLEDLAACPEGSLGHGFYRMTIDNGFDLEVLDRDTLALERLPEPLHYLNARILQLHDLWHIVGGYHLTGLHEIAISGFQLAQFGHGYSAMFLAMVVGSTTLKANAYVPVMLETILSAWVHGRQTPALLGVVWEDVWTRPTEEIRRELGVKAYDSPFPSNLFEQAAAA